MHRLCLALKLRLCASRRAQVLPVLAKERITVVLNKQKKRGKKTMKTLQLNNKNEITLLKGSCDMHPVEILNPEKNHYRVTTGLHFAILQRIIC